MSSLGSADSFLTTSPSNDCPPASSHHHLGTSTQHMNPGFRCEVHLERRTCLSLLHLSPKVDSAGQLFMQMFMRSSLSNTFLRGDVRRRDI